MLSSITSFPREQFVTCVRNKGQGFQPFMKQIKNPNTQWIYQATKHLYNTLFQSKEAPQIKLTALKLCKSLLQTCQIPCLILIEVYILPMIYQITIYKPQQTGLNRGNRFFIQSGYSQRIPKIQEIGVQFVSLCTEILTVGSQIKRKRTLLNQQMGQNSDYVQFYQKFKKYAISGTQNLLNKLKYFNKEDVGNLHKRYLTKLQKFEPLSQQYSTFFVRKMVQSLQTQQNILFTAANKTTSSLSNDLDMKKFLKFGDAYVTSTLIQQIIDGLITSQNFVVKRNNLSLFSDLIKWADIQAILQLNYDEFIQQIAQKIAQVNGEKGLSEGENIYPEIKGQKQGKKKFYIQFLKSLEIWSKLLKKNMIDDQQNSKAEQLYQYFKIQRNFIFPQNLMIKRLQQDYEKCLVFNQQKNQMILAKLHDDQSELNSNKKSTSLHKKKQKSISIHKKTEHKQQPRQVITFEAIQNKLNEVVQDFATLCDQDDKIDQKMRKLIAFKQNFDDDLQNIEDEEPDQDQLMMVLDDGDALTTNIDEIIPIYNDYKTKKISLNKFKQLFENKLEQLQYQDSQSKTVSQQNPHKSESTTMAKDNMILNSLNQNNNGDILQNSLTGSQTQNKNKLQKINLEKEAQKQPIQTINVQSQMSQQSVNIKQKTIKIKNQSIHNRSYQTNSLLSKDKKKNEYQHKNNLSRLQNCSIDSINRKSQLSQRIKSIRKSKVKDNEESGSSGQSKKNSQYFAEISKQQSPYYANKNKVDSKTDNIKQKKSMKQKVSELRSNRGNLSVSRFSHSRNNVSHQSINDKIIKSRLNTSMKPRNITNKQVNQSRNNCQTPEQAQNLYTQVPNDKMMKVNNQKSQIKQVRKSLKNGNMSSISRKSSSVLSHKSRNRSKIFKKDISGVSSIIKNQRKQVGEAYNIINYDKPITQQKQPNKSKYNTESKIQQNRYFNANQLQYKKNKQKNLNSKVKESNQPHTFAAQFLLSNHQSDQESDNYKIKPDVQNKLVQNSCKKSNYGMEQLQTRAKLMKKTQIKNSQSPIVRDVRPYQTRNMKSSAYSYDRLPRKNSKASQIRYNLENKPQQQYLMMKMKRQNTQQRNQQLKAMQDRIFRLKTQSSRLRSQLSSRSNRNKEYSIGRRSSSNSSYQDFRRSHSSSRNSLKRKGSIASISKNSMNLDGKLFNDAPFSRYTNDINQDIAKKSMLKNKTLIVKNKDLQIGCLFRKDHQALKIMLYITPERTIRNFTYNIQKQPNLKIRSYPEKYSQIPQKKQAKITVAVQITTFPYRIPNINMQYTTSQIFDKKCISFMLPCPIHRFLDYISPKNIKQFQLSFENNQNKMIKTNQFAINRKIGKLQLLKEYFPGLALISKENNITKYGATCKNSKQSFSLLIFTRDSHYMAIQGIPHNRPQFLEFFMFSIKQIFETIY